MSNNTDHNLVNINSNSNCMIVPGHRSWTWVNGGSVAMPPRGNWIPNQPRADPAGRRTCGVIYTGQTL